MATKILRPVSDSSVAHSLSSGSTSYQLLSESTQDGDATYIYQDVTGTSSSSKITKVGFGAMFPATNFNVTAVKVYCVARITNGAGKSSITITGLVNGQGAGTGSSVSPGTSYASSSISSTTSVSYINQALQSGVVPTFEVSIATSGNKSKSKDDDFQIRITQLYVELTYDEIAASTTELYAKENGVWKKYTQAYKKVNGQWVLQSNLSGVFSSGVNYVRGN